MQRVPMIQTAETDSKGRSDYILWSVCEGYLLGRMQECVEREAGSHGRVLTHCKPPQQNQQMSHKHNNKDLSRLQ